MEICTPSAEGGTLHQQHLCRALCIAKTTNIQDVTGYRWIQYFNVFEVLLVGIQWIPRSRCLSSIWTSFGQARHCCGVESTGFGSCAVQLSVCSCVVTLATLTLPVQAVQVCVLWSELIVLSESDRWQDTASPYLINSSMDDVLLLSNALLSSRMLVFLNCLSRFLGVLCCRTAVSANHVLRCQKGSNSRRPQVVAILQSVNQQLVSWPDPNIAHLERINHHLAALFAARWVQMTGLACDLPSFVEGVLFHWESLGRSGCSKSDSNVLAGLWMPGRSIPWRKCLKHAPREDQPGSANPGEQNADMNPCAAKPLCNAVSRQWIHATKYVDVDKGCHLANGVVWCSDSCRGANWRLRGQTSAKLLAGLSPSDWIFQ